MQSGRTALGAKDRIQKLGRPRLVAMLAIIRKAVLCWVSASDSCRTKDNVPQEQKIAEVARVVPNAVILCQRVMRIVRRWRGNGSL